MNNLREEIELSNGNEEQLMNLVAKLFRYEEDLY
jgi:hypothetical protein